MYIIFADCAGNVVNLVPYNKELPEEKIGYLVILSGTGMPVQKSVKNAVNWYEKYVIEVK